MSLESIRFSQTRFAARQSSGSGTTTEAQPNWPIQTKRLTVSKDTDYGTHWKDSKLLHQFKALTTRFGEIWDAVHKLVSPEKPEDAVNTVNVAGLKIKLGGYDEGAENDWKDSWFKPAITFCQSASVFFRTLVLNISPGRIIGGFVQRAIDSLFGFKDDDDDTSTDGPPVSRNGEGAGGTVIEGQATVINDPGSRT